MWRLKVLPHLRKNVEEKFKKIVKLLNLKIVLTIWLFSHLLFWHQDVSQWNSNQHQDISQWNSNIISIQAEKVSLEGEGGSAGPQTSDYFYTAMPEAKRQQGNAYRALTECKSRIRPQSDILRHIQFSQSRSKVQKKKSEMSSSRLAKPWKIISNY